jgi:hypothetical protein
MQVPQDQQKQVFDLRLQVVTIIISAYRGPTQGATFTDDVSAEPQRVLAIQARGAS